MSITIDVSPDPPIAGTPLSITVCGPVGSVPAVAVTVTPGGGVSSLMPPPESTHCWSTQINLPSTATLITIDASAGACTNGTAYPLI